jgi:Recombinase
MDNATARKRRYRQKRRAGHLKAYEVWLPTALVDELRQPEETMNALVARALAALRQQAPGTVTAAELDPGQRKAALVARIQAMDAAGLTLQAIADRLHAEQVPTLSGKGRWQKGTVGNLLAEAKAAPSV